MTVTDTTATTVPESEVPSPTAEERKAAKQAEVEEQAAQGAEALGSLAAGALARAEEAPTVPGTDLALVPPWREMQGMAAMAVTLSGANALPSALRNRPNDVFMVLLTARDCGVSLTTALREFHVIDGKVTLSPKVKLAMLNERGKREGWKVWPDPANDAEKATWHATREDRPGVQFSSSFTKAEAALAGLNNKDNWKKYPKRMMSWRALGYLLDDVFPEVATGLYDPDSVGAVTDEDGVPVIDVRSTEALPGMRSPSGHGAGGDDDEPLPAEADEKAAIKRRIDALAPGCFPKAEEGAPSARAALMALWTDSDGKEPLAAWHSLLARHVKRAEAMIASIEARARKGEWGTWTPPADAETGEVKPPTDAPDETVKAPAVALHGYSPDEMADHIGAFHGNGEAGVTEAAHTAFHAAGAPSHVPHGHAKYHDSEIMSLATWTDPAPAATPDAVEGTDNPAEAATMPVEAPEADAAPDGAEEAPPTTEADAVNPPEGPEPDMLEGIIADVKAMKPGQVVAELVKRGEDVGGTPSDKQQRLCGRLLRERLGQDDAPA